MIRYKYELALAGMVEGPFAPFDTDPPIIVRMETLRRYREGRLHPSWYLKPLFPPGASSEARHWTLKGGVLPYAVQAIFGLYRAPSTIRAIQERIWTFDLGSFDFHFTMCSVDTSQDLLVLSASPREWTE